MRTQLITVAAVVMLCALSDAAAQTTSNRVPPKTPAPQDGQAGSAAPVRVNLAGTWKSAPYELKLTTDFDRSVWGPNAMSVRNVDLTINASGEGTLTVTSKVVDGRGQAKPASVTIEEAKIQLAGTQETMGPRTEHAVKVLSAERRYPDDPGYKWPIEGLRVKLATIEGAPENTIEIRYDTPEGRGSFWETLVRQRQPARRAAR